MVGQSQESGATSVAMRKVDLEFGEWAKDYTADEKDGWIISTPDTVENVYLSIASRNSFGDRNRIGLLMWTHQQPDSVLSNRSFNSKI